MRGDGGGGQEGRGSQGREIGGESLLPDPSEIPVLGLGDARELREETEVSRRRGVGPPTTYRKDLT